MKTILTIATFILLYSFSSCKKQENKFAKSDIINISLKVNEQYSYDLGYFGDEESAIISTQANHFSQSKLERSISLDKILYTYIPQTNFIGEDEVTLKSYRGSNGASMNTNIVYTTIHFVITK